MTLRSSVAISLAAAWLPVVVHAQDQDRPAAGGEDDPLGFDEIVVTAAARAMESFDSPVSVSTLDSEAIVAPVPRTTAEIFRWIPGIRSEATGGDGNANIAARGLPIASGGAKFLQLQEDGMPVMQFGDIAFGNADIFLRADRTVASIQAVRGGSASTLASNAPGGVINLISKDGSEDGGEIAATLGLGYREHRIDFDYGGRIAESTRFNIGGFWRKGEGVRDAGYDGNRGYQVKANLTQEFAAGYVRLYGKRMDDRAIGYLPMPALVTGTNRNPRFASLPGFDIGSDTTHSALFRSDFGLDGNNRPHATDITDGMHPVVTSLGLEAAFEIAEGITLEERFRWSDVHGRFVSPFPAEIGSGQDIGLSVGQALAGSAGAYHLVYANGPAAGQALAADALAMRVHLFNVDINDFGSFANDFKLSANLGTGSVTAGYYKARQHIDMDWVWNSYLLDVQGHDAALLDVADAAGTLVTRGGLYAYGVPFWGNCCQRSYDVRYDIDAPYLAASFDTGRLSMDAGLRYDRVRARGSYAGPLQRSFDVNGDGVIQPVETSVSLIDNVGARPVAYAVGYVSWSLGANFRFSDAVAAFARVSRGGRANADRLLFGLVQPDGSVRKADAVDFVDQIEFGVKYRSGPFGLFVTGFRARTQEQNFEATSRRFLDRTYKATGVEIEAAYRSGILDLRAGATWNDAAIARDAITAVNAGNTPRRQPRLIYQFSPAIDLDVVRTGLAVIGTTRAYAQDSNRLVMPGYAQVNAFLAVRLPASVELSLQANNLFSAVGVTEAEEGSIVDGGSTIVRARSITGRTVSVTLRRSF